jgi:glycosyltransferase involved in cell wall biosynthesis
MAETELLRDSHIELRTGADVSSTPVVSVIIPAYNAASLVPDALGSVFGQTYKRFETLVVNDGSPDTEKLEEVLEPYIERIVYIKQNNRRAAGARNTGIRHARGEFLAFLDSDEWWLPEFLTSQMKLFEEDPSLDMVYCDAIQGKGRETFMQACPSNGPCTFESLIKQECDIPISAVVARKRVIVKAGLFDESLPCIDDADMWLRVAYHGGKISYQKAPLTYACPDRPGSLGQHKINTAKASITIFTKLAEVQMRPATRALVIQRLAFEQAMLDLTQGKSALVSGNFSEADICLKNANSYFKTWKLRLVLAGLKVAPRLTRGGAKTWWRRLTAEATDRESYPRAQAV